VVTTTAAISGRISLALPPGTVKLVDEHGTPYYLSQANKTTQYVDPRVDRMLRTVATELRWIRLAAYRTATKLRALQHFTALSVVRADELFNCFHLAEQQLPELHDPTATLTSEVMSTVLLQIYSRSSNQMARVEMMVSLLLLCFDRHRSGTVPLQSFKVALTLLSAGWCEEKFRLMFAVFDTDQDGFITCVDLGRLLVAMSRVLEVIDEAYAFFPTNAAVDAAVDTCYTGQAELVGAGEIVGVEAFVEWALEEPDVVCWLPTLHRLAAAETQQHDTRCSNAECAMEPIIGFRYDRGKASLCQFCFWNRDRPALSGTSDHEWIEHCYPPKGKAKRAIRRVSRQRRSSYTAIRGPGAGPERHPITSSTRDWLGLSSEDDEDGLRRDLQPVGLGLGGTAGPPLPRGHGKGDADLGLDELRLGINKVVGSLRPTQLSSGEPTPALFSLASGFDEEQKRYLLRVIDELDSENQTLLQQLTDVRDTAIEAAEQSMAPAAVAEPAPAPPVPPAIPAVSASKIAAGRRAESAAALEAIEEELAEAARSGVVLRNPMSQVNLGPLASVTTKLADELEAFSALTILGEADDARRSNAGAGWPAAARDDTIAQKLRHFAVGLRPEPAVVYGDLGMPRRSYQPIPNVSVEDDDDSAFI